jgi:uncharacterized protein (DUF2147 family)
MIRIASLAVVLALAAGHVRAAPVPEGVWSTPGGKATIRISACGPNLCATLIGLRKPNDKAGRPKVDKRNPDRSLRSRPVIGLPLARGMRPDGGGWRGEVYNPDDGRTYAGRIERAGDGALRLRGCALKVLCQTQRLARVR